MPGEAWLLAIFILRPTPAVTLHPTVEFPSKADCDRKGAASAIEELLCGNAAGWSCTEKRWRVRREPP